jgi:integrase/recombinase XerD
VGSVSSKFEGKTPEISVAQARRLIASVDDSTIVGLRDKAILATLIFTAARIGAVSSLTTKDFFSNGEQWLFRFKEKGGKAREIPVRHDLALLLKRYLELAAIPTNISTPLFRSSAGRSGKLSSNGMCADDIRRMLKRHLKNAGLPGIFSPHSFRVCALTDLLKQDVPREDVQYLAGHADPRTTSLYDRRKKKVTRNIVERISVKL